MKAIDTAMVAGLAAILREAGRTEVMPRFRRLSPDAVREKTGPLDIVTEADTASEAMIAARLRSLLPDALFVGEEGVAADPSLLDRLAEAPLAVVVDPIDGTSNYAAGLPLFAVMAAIVERGRVIAGVIHDPVCDDSAIAIRGEGAWIETADGTRQALRVSAPGPARRMSGCASWRYIPEPLRGTVIANLPKVAGSWQYRCAAHEYRLLAAGHCDFALYHRLMPWDHLAGWLLHREAGGYSARLDGQPYRPSDREGGLLYAPDEESWRALRDLLLTPDRAA